MFRFRLTFFWLMMVSGLMLSARVVAEDPASFPEPEAYIDEMPSDGVIDLPQAATPCGGSVGPDVIVGDVVVDSGSNFASVGGIDAFAWGTTSCNMGNQPLMWQSQTSNHPVIPQNMYRRKNVDGATRFEQIGMGWMKHGFTALTGNACGCGCQSPGTGSLLGVGCSDPYSSGLNGTQCTGSGQLGPRFQVNPHSGAFIFPFMFRSNCTYITHTSITRRCQVMITDLDPALNPGAVYYAEAQYVTPDDAASRNQDNNCSYEPINITGGPTNFNATSAGATVRELPAIKAWKLFDPSVIETTISTPEAANTGGDTTGTCILAAKATHLGGGTYRYEYALFNMNSDRCISSFSIPVSSGLNATNIGFHDVFYHDGDGYNSTTSAPVTFDGTDWPGVHSGGNVTWAIVPATPVENSNALRWGTMYNFRFDCNAEPASGNVTLGFFKPVSGQPNSMQAATVVPTASVPCDSPVITPPPAQSAVCEVAFTFNVSITGTPPFNWSLSDQPAGMTIDSNGQINWPSPAASAGAYEFSINAESNCGGGTAVERMSLSVVLGDFNADGLVTTADLDAFADHLLEISTVSPCAADVNEDGDVDGRDVDKYLELLGL